MGTNNRTKRIFVVILLSIFMMTASGCILPGSTPFPLPPTPTPTPTNTPLPPTPTPPPPTPTAAATPRLQCAIRWHWEVTELIIDKVDLSRADGLAPGDRVMTINGKLSLERILEAEDILRESTPAENLRPEALRYILKNNSMLVLLVQHKGEPPYFFNLRPGCG